MGTNSFWVFSDRAKCTKLFFFGAVLRASTKKRKQTVIDCDQRAGEAIIFTSDSRQSMSTPMSDNEGVTTKLVVPTVQRLIALERENERLRIENHRLELVVARMNEKIWEVDSAYGATLPPSLQQKLKLLHSDMCLHGMSWWSTNHTMPHTT